MLLKIIYCFFIRSYEHFKFKNSASQLNFKRIFLRGFIISSVILKAGEKEKEICKGICCFLKIWKPNENENTFLMEFVLFCKIWKPIKNI